MYLAGLVLCDLVLGVFLAVPALAVCPPCLRNVDLRAKNCQLCIRPLCAFEPKSNPLLSSLVSIVPRLETVSVTIDVKGFWKFRRCKVGNMPNIQIDIKCGSLRVSGCGVRLDSGGIPSIQSILILARPSRRSGEQPSIVCVLS
jgi:hypothetical protein